MGISPELRPHPGRAAGSATESRRPARTDSQEEKHEHSEQVQRHGERMADRHDRVMRKLDPGAAALNREELLVRAEKHHKDRLALSGHISHSHKFPRHQQQHHIRGRQLGGSSGNSSRHHHRLDGGATGYNRNHSKSANVGPDEDEPYHQGKDLSRYNLEQEGGGDTFLGGSGSSGGGAGSGPSGLYQFLTLLLCFLVFVAVVGLVVFYSCHKKTSEDSKTKKTTGSSSTAKADEKSSSTTTTTTIRKGFNIADMEDDKVNQTQAMLAQGGGKTNGTSATKHDDMIVGTRTDYVASKSDIAQLLHHQPPQKKDSSQTETKSNGATSDHESKSKPKNTTAHIPAEDRKNSTKKNETSTSSGGGLGRESPTTPSTTTKKKELHGTDVVIEPSVDKDAVSATSANTTSGPPKASKNSTSTTATKQAGKNKDTTGTTNETKSDTITTTPLQKISREELKSAGHIDIAKKTVNDTKNETVVEGKNQTNSTDTLTTNATTEEKNMTGGRAEKSKAETAGMSGGALIGVAVFAMLVLAFILIFFRGTRTSWGNKKGKGRKTGRNLSSFSGSGSGTISLSRMSITSGRKQGACSAGNVASLRTRIHAQMNKAPSPTTPPHTASRGGLHSLRKPKRSGSSSSIHSGLGHKTSEEKHSCSSHTMKTANKTKHTHNTATNTKFAHHQHGVGRLDAYSSAPVRHEILKSEKAKRGGGLGAQHNEAPSKTPHTHHVRGRGKQQPQHKSLDHAATSSKQILLVNHSYP